MAPTKKAGKKAAAAAASSSAPAKAAGPTRVAKADWKEGFKKKTAGVSDMTLLSTITDDSINENLKKRFENAEIYTYIAHVLISVNPFRLLPIYSDETLKSYRGKNRLELPPHVYAIAETAYYNMTSYKEDQCVIISGESGAGKTEAAKRIIQYIAAVSGETGAGQQGIERIKEMVLATNPLLESFGCAKTLRNNNSSRHGKYLEIEFNGQGEPVGAIITNYLLEKGRVVGQIEGERNFHILYQFTKGASPAQREAYGLQGPEAYRYTSDAKCFDVDGIDDVGDWNETLKAMDIIGITPQEQDQILKVLATVLWLGNLHFQEDAESQAHISDESVPNFIAYLMEVDAALVTKALTTRVMETQRGGRRGSVYDVPHNETQARAARDALAKAMYNNLFEWIVTRVNMSLKSSAANRAERIVGVLDIYGFEIFQTNSFEQLCINYVNEKLQQIFIELTLKTEQEEYVREQIKWTPIDYFNNKVVIDLLEEKRPPGVFAALNDACATAHADPEAADSSFVQRLNFLSSNQHFENRQGKFIVKHYAGDVQYDIRGMTEKNKDVLSKDLVDLIGVSGNGFLQDLFPDRPDPTSKKRPPTAGDKIKGSANALVEKLMRSQPSYIRTIKPNQNKSPSEYDTKAILHQIKYLGLKENIRVRRAGFAYRNTFEKMVERFYLLSPATSYAGEYIWQGDAKSGCERILKDTGIAKEEWQMGVTKAFIKNPETLFALEHMRDRYWHNMAARIQRAFRNYLRYRQECAVRIQKFWSNKKEGIAYSRLREYGHQVLAGRKERRRFSLLSMRQFQGDYLGLKGGSASGEGLKNAAGIGGENVAFSSRIQLLVSKFGRSSKPSPRFFILTDKSIYILITEKGDGGRPVTRVERKILLGTITSVGLSNLRDDWVVLNVQSPEEPDPLFICPFKTEMVTHLLQQSNGRVGVTISDKLQYSKKKDKKATIEFRRDPASQADVYKSSVVTVGPGEPANSVSMPPAKRKPGIVRPITSGKLLRPGGPSQNQPKPASRPIPQSRPLPTGSTSAVPTAPRSVGGAVANGVSRTPAAPAAAAARPPPAPPSRAAAPPPPPPPSQPQVPKYKALYDFPSNEEGEMSLVKNELVELVKKDDNGWWLIKKGSKEGWAPSNYLKLEETPPPPPPAPAPVAARRAPPAAPAPASGAGANGDLRSAIAARASDANGNGTANGSPASSRPGSSLSKTGPPPAPKPKPAVGPKPPVPAASRPSAPAAPPRPGGAIGAAKPPVAPAGQLDLSAILARRRPPSPE